MDDLRPVGLSPQKASYLADLAGKVNDGTVHLRQIGRLSDERTVDHLTQLKGIGRWTAQIVLVFSLDVLPPRRFGRADGCPQSMVGPICPTRTRPWPLPFPGDVTPRWHARIVGGRWI